MDLENRIADGILRSLDGLLLDGDDPAVVHACDSLTELEDAVVVGHDDDGPVGPNGHLAEQLHHGETGLVVESGRGLVADQEPRFVDQGPRDGDPLHLAARELAREAAELLPMPIAESRTSPARRTARSRDQPAITSGIAAFSAAVRAGRRLYCWNTNPIFRARKLVARPVAHRRQRVAEDVDLALIAIEDSGDDRQERRLSAARRTDDQRHLARVDVPVDTAATPGPAARRCRNAWSARESAPRPRGPIAGASPGIADRRSPT